jgi:fructosamine-3-kinase
MNIWLKIETELKTKIISKSVVHGGSINQAYSIKTANNKQYFCKINYSAPEDFFTREIEGLINLSQIKTWKVPKPICKITYQQTQALIMEFVPRFNETVQFWENAGISLASLHKITYSKFGWHTDNYIGSLLQKNSFSETWEDFYISNRIMPLLKIAFDKRIISLEETKKFNLLFKRVNNLFPKEKPTLIHGDLWKGNIMATKNNMPSSYDPAIYYGHREADLAMTHLFGSFPDTFYRAYNSIYPLEDEFTNRINYFNLYPLLVHVILFGKSYWYDIDKILNTLK